MQQAVEGNGGILGGAAGAAEAGGAQDAGARELNWRSTNKQKSKLNVDDNVKEGKAKAGHGDCGLRTATVSSKLQGACSK